MGRLRYSMSVSLDGFVNAPDGSLDWVDVDEELHSWFNDEAREEGVFLYGRRMYELMAGYWPTAHADPAATPAMLDFATVWRDMPKVVFSSTLREVGFNSRLVHEGAADEVARIKAETDRPLSVAGPTLASTLIERGLVDEYRVYVHPVILGAGTPFFPPVAGPIPLRPVNRREFANGVVMLGYEADRPS